MRPIDFLAGMIAGAAIMAAVGFELERQSRPHTTLPRPADTFPAPPPPADPADLIPPQRLPIPERPAPNFDE